MARLIIIGAPGSGKGTQALHIAAHFGIPAVSTGDIFRANVKDGTPLGAEAGAYLDRGEFVPDRITTAMVRRRLSEADAQAGFLLDGYPRNVAQIAELDAFLSAAGRGLDAVIQLAVEDRELVGRLLNRAQEQGRSDDTAEVIRRRLELYESETEPVVTAYFARGLLVCVDGTGAPEDVAQRAIAAVGDALARTAG